MPSYALLENDIVKNIIIAEDQDTADLFGVAVECDPSKLIAIGWTYDGENFLAPTA
jgi:hypothetical protein